MLFYILLFLALLLCIHLLLNYNAKARLINKVPGPKIAFIFGDALGFAVSPVELMKLGAEYTQKWKNIFKFWSYPFGAVNIYNPTDIETVIATTRFNDKSIVYEFLKPWLQSGLLVSKGEKWHQRRKLLTPAFHFNILKKFFVTLEENSKRLVDVLSQTEKPVDIVPIISEFTLHSICETAMGTQLSKETTNEGRSYKQAIYNLGELVTYRFTRIYLYPNFIFNNSLTGRKMRKHLGVVHNFTDKVIKDRRQYIDNDDSSLSQDIDDNENEVYKKKKMAMLDLLLLGERDGSIDEVGIKEEVDTFMFEGHDTTAAGLAFTYLEIANNKNIQEKIYNELQDIFGDSDRPCTVEDLTKMRYLELCIKESLRLYPPVHFISRQLNENVTLSGYKIPAGTICHIHILHLHRNPSLFENPMVFDPDRFLPENSNNRHPYAYIPFSAGPRNCIGQKFAIMEMKLAISETLRKLELIPITRPEELEFTADLVLRNSKPIYISCKRRTAV